jgi:hypothetical protein
VPIVAASLETVCMPPEKPHQSNPLRYLCEKVEELCERQERVESEILGEIGNPEKPSIRDDIKTLRADVNAIQEKNAARERNREAITIGTALTAIGALFTAVGSFFFK